MPSDCYDRALMLLTRREHSVHELKQKLNSKGFDSEAIAQAIARCQELGYQSDERFTQMYVNARIQKGYGPIKIKYELSARGIDDELATQTLNSHHDWVLDAINAFNKKFNASVALDATDLAKQKRFLFNRGFSHDVIKQTMKEIYSEL